MTSESNDERRTSLEPATTKRAKLEGAWLLVFTNSGLGKKVSGGETVSKDGLSLVCAIGAQEERAAFSGRRVRTTGRYEA